MVLLLKNYFSVLNECYVPIHEITLSHFSLSGPSPFLSLLDSYISVYTILLLRYTNITIMYVEFTNTFIQP